MLKESFITHIETIGNHKALKVCMQIEGLPVLAATYSFKSNSARVKLHHEVLAPIPEAAQKAYLDKITEYAREYRG
jgi:hypothetical protein